MSSLLLFIQLIVQLLFLRYAIAAAAPAASIRINIMFTVFIAAVFVVSAAFALSLTSISSSTDACSSLTMSFTSSWVISGSLVICSATRKGLNDSLCAFCRVCAQVKAVRIRDQLFQGADVCLRSRVQACLSSASSPLHRSLPGSSRCSSAVLRGIQLLLQSFYAACDIVIEVSEHLGNELDLMFERARIQRDAFQVRRSHRSGS